MQNGFRSLLRVIFWFLESAKISLVSTNLRINAEIQHTETLIARRSAPDQNPSALDRFFLASYFSRSLITTMYQHSFLNKQSFSNAS